MKKMNEKYAAPKAEVIEMNMTSAVLMGSTTGAGGGNNPGQGPVNP